VRSQPSYIATRELLAEDASRGQFTIHLCIGCPYEISADEWACPVALDGLYPRLRDQHGIDAFQSLMLAQKLARALLLAFVEDGGILRDSHDSDNHGMSIENLFGGGTLP
jgi:hypothetical protein